MLFNLEVQRSPLLNSANGLNSCNLIGNLLKRYVSLYFNVKFFLSSTFVSFVLLKQLKLMQQREQAIQYGQFSQPMNFKCLFGLVGRNLCHSQSQTSPDHADSTGSRVLPDKLILNDDKKKQLHCPAIPTIT
jgi:hypothetical protein